MARGILNKASTLATLAMVSALAGGGLGAFGGTHETSNGGRCPQCQKGRLVRSVTGARYCHRCGYFASKDGVVKTRTRDQDG